MVDKVILVTRDDCEVGIATKLKVHQEGLLHRAFSIFVTREGSQGLEILLQKRHRQKYHSGGLWSNTCCGHPRPGETTQDAAQRRLLEEMGLAMSLQEIGSFHYEARLGNGLVENEIDHVFVGKLGDQPFTANLQEVEEHAWVPIIAVSQDCQDHPEKFTAWFKPALQVLHDLGDIYD
ncbi:MAG: isopentenyl-diphosphate Delta-isomerase [Alphaproteobacteria bacterium]